jgi:type IX secretion system PorP/SprF family membrane protein
LIRLGSTIFATLKGFYPLFNALAINLMLFSLRTWVACILVVGFGSTLAAQDIHFSQFYMSPLNLNPAMTGVMNCTRRLSGNYRNQWASVLRSNAYSTFSGSYDQRIPVGRYDNFGAGLTLWSDKAGSLDFGTMQVKGSFSYAKRLGGDRVKSHFLVLGADVGYTQRGYDAAKARWGTQNVNGSWDPSLPSQEDDLVRNNISYADMSAGILWFSVIDKFNSYYIGGAYSHINEANQSFTSDKIFPHPPKYTMHAGGDFLIAPRLGILPGAVVFTQNKLLEVNTGTSLKFYLGNDRRIDQALQLGVWTRLAHKLDKGNLMDALIFSTRFDYDQFSIGFSYDLNTSDFNAATNGNGAFELALLYKICGQEKRNLYCPNF